MAWKGEEGRTAPKDVCGGRVGVAFGGVEEEITDASAGDVLVLCGNVCEDYAGGDFFSCPEFGESEKVGFA